MDPALEQGLDTALVNMDDTEKWTAFNHTIKMRPTAASFEYVEVCYLFLFAAIGIPINLFTLARVGRQYYVTKSRILLLNVNLNISDLMILFFYAFVDAVWFTTEQWLGGALLCKLLMFLQLFSFCLSSNVIVCIGVDRLWSLLAPLHVKSAANRRCRYMVMGAWLLALLSSAPQVYLWNVQLGSDYSQCVNTYGLAINGTLDETFAQRAAGAAVFYDIYHLLITFWLPCILVIICYVIILTRVMKHLGDDSHVEILQTKTCDCSSGSASAPATGSPYMDTGIRKPRRQQFRLEPHSDRVPNSISRKCHCETSCGGRPLTTTNTLHQYTLRRSAGQMRIRRTKYKTLKVTMFIVAAYVICWLPYNFLAIWSLIYPESETPSSLINFLCGLIALNAIVNPLIYGRLTLALYWRGSVQGLRRRRSEKAARRRERRAGRFI